MINALFRRYKIFFFIGFLILAFQFYLAYKSIKIPIESKNQNQFSGVKVNNERRKGQHQAISLNDDEDIINSNIQQDAAHKVNEKQSASASTSSFLNELSFKPKCDILSDKEVVSAVQRARTQQCKQNIIDIACQIKSGLFYPKNLPNTCPSGNYIANRLLGCYRDDKKHRLLPNFYTNFKETNSPKKCIQMCLQSGYLYAGVQYSTECFCGNQEPPQNSKLSDPNCNMKCPSESKSACGGYFTMNIYETGIAKFSSQIAEAQPKNNDEKVKIVFLLTLNGRALRQVYRLIKALYSVDHYYYIHVDSRQDYLYRELLKLESMFPNIRLTRRRFSTIWGGASLLEMLLSCMSELLTMEWRWDFVLNLSESDYPIKTLDKLEEFLGANREKNFVKSHGREAQRFIQKQGLDKTFVECDTHMWRIGERSLPSGISIDGGSDWVCLSKKFIEFITQDERDSLIEGLLRIFSHTLLPAESFFHTAIRNSVFCNTYIDNNLHITNWKRKMGCKCQYKAIVDWCGCSPNDFKPDDWPRLQATEQKQLFFGRKFEPVINQKIILQLEEKLFGPYPEEFVNLNSYWQSTYHHHDKSPPPNTNLLTIAESLIRINSKSNLIQFYEPLRIKEIYDHFENDVYKGFLIRHEARINANSTVELETFCAPNNQHAQVSKSIKIAKKIMQLDVSTDPDQKELLSRNFARVMGEKSDPVLILKLLGSTSSHSSSNNSESFSVLWVDPNDKVRDSQELNIDDITTTTINFVKSNLQQPLLPGVWTAKLFQKKNIIGLTKFLITPSVNETTKDSYSSQNNLDKMISNFYLIKETCISFNHKNIRDIIGNYLSANDLNDNFHKFNECKKSVWSSLSPDPKSELVNDPAFFDGSS